MGVLNNRFFFLTFQPVHSAFCINEMKFWTGKRVGLLTSRKISSRGEGSGTEKIEMLPHPPRACHLHMENPHGHIEVSLNVLRFSWECERGVHFTSFFLCHLDNRKSPLGFQALLTSSKHGNSNILTVFAGQF